MARSEFHDDAHPEATELTGNREYGPWGQCVGHSKSADRRCRQPAKGSHGKCSTHGGATPTKDENPNVGNGDQEGNQNAMKDGVRSDPVKLFDWLAENDEAALAYILSKLHDYAEGAPKPVFVVGITPDDVDSFDDAQAALTAYGDDLLLMCIRDYTRWRASKRQVVEGMLTEQTRSGDHGTYTVVDENPVNLGLDRQDKTTLRMKDKFGLLPDDGVDVQVTITDRMWQDLTEYYD